MTNKQLVALVAGNIYAEVSAEQVRAYRTSYPAQAIAESVERAREIVAEVERTEPVPVAPAASQEAQ